jgi:hypothetical protein
MQLTQAASEAAQRQQQQRSLSCNCGEVKPSMDGEAGAARAWNGGGSFPLAMLAAAALIAVRGCGFNSRLGGARATKNSACSGASSPADLAIHKSCSRAFQPVSPSPHSAPHTEDIVLVVQSLLSISANTLQATHSQLPSSTPPPPRCVTHSASPFSLPSAPRPFPRSPIRSSSPSRRSATARSRLLLQLLP